VGLLTVYRVAEEIRKEEKRKRKQAAAYRATERIRKGEKREREEAKKRKGRGIYFGKGSK